MTNKDNGGPAFPRMPGGSPGLSLRDYFAAKAMAACISNMSGNIGVGYEANNTSLAMASYSIADAMLLERAK